MATPSSDSTAVVPQATPSAHAITPAPLATDEQRICFVCLQTDKDIPDAEWVNACPCTLDAHSACMLHWIAEMEASGKPRKQGLRCPVCKAPIRLEEPYDRFLAIRDRLYARYSHLSPYMLMFLMSGGGIAGAACYGFSAASIFAGRDAVERWLGLRAAHQRIPVFLLKYWGLSFIGPGLVIMRWMPFAWSVLFLPFSVLSGGLMLARDGLPSWPPSPMWAATVIPATQLAYAFLKYGLFGPLERRLNSALRGHFAADELVAPAAEGGAALAALQPVAQAAAVGDDGQRAGMWTFVANLAGAAIDAVMDLFPEDEEDEEPRRPEAEVVRVAVYDDGRLVAGDDDEFSDPDEEVILQALEDSAAEERAPQEHLAQGEQPVPEEQLGPEEQSGAPEGQPAAQEPSAPDEQSRPGEQPAPQDQPADPDNRIGAVAGQTQNDQANNHNQPDDNPAPIGGVSAVTLIINSITTSLLFPAISYGMGELIRAAVPKGWARRPLGGSSPTGLLQQRWGRSLLGGCLFVVLRDAFALYTKYRRAQVRAGRRIKNVERGAARSGGGGNNGARG